MTKKQLIEKLDLDENHVKASKGTFTIFRSFFYGGGKQDQMKLKLIAKAHDAGVKINIIDSGSHWHAFVGGAKSGSAQDSYDYVKFEVLA